MAIAKFWRWMKVPEDAPAGNCERGELQLLDPCGRVRATVWKNGVWHLWDEDGVGSENGAALRENGEFDRPHAEILKDAMDQCIAAVVRQGWSAMKLAYDLHILEEKKT